MKTRDLFDMAMDHEATASKMQGAAEALELMLRAIVESSEDGATLSAGELHGLSFAVHMARDLAGQLVEEAEVITKAAVASSAQVAA